MINVESAKNKVVTALSACGLHIASVLDSNDNDIWFITVDPDNLGRLLKEVPRSKTHVERLHKILKQSPDRIYSEHRAWAVALAGLELGVIDRDEARAIARSWASQDVPDSYAIPYCLLQDK